MLIHVVKAHETISSIAHDYKISPYLLCNLNGLTPGEGLAEGQALLILFPEQLHHVVAGDTLCKIAAHHNISLRQLYRNNPGLIQKTYIYPGDELVIRYHAHPETNITAAAYAYPFIDISLFLETLPFTTIFNSFTWEITPDGHLKGLNDEALVAVAKNEGTAPHMVLSNLREPYGFDSDIAHNLLRDPSQWPVFIDEVVQTVLIRGYSGVDLDFEFVLKQDREHYARFAHALARRLHMAGCHLTIALSAKTSEDASGTLVEGLDYKALGEAADMVLIMTYEWGYPAGEPMAIAPIGPVTDVVEFAITRIPREKILLGIPTYGYNWPLPWIKGQTRAVSVSNPQAIALARTYGSVIQYDETALAPWFTYTDAQDSHEVWFEDVRSILAKLKLISKYKLKGAGYWNMMRPFTQNWMLLNSMFSILPGTDAHNCKRAAST